MSLNRDDLSVAFRWSAAALCLACLFAVPVGAAKVVPVDCTKGERIGDALLKSKDDLIVEIHGMCMEDVLIRRDGVVLRGTDPNSDGVQAVGTEDFRGAAVFIRDARRVSLENLKLTGGVASGLRVETSRREISVSNCRMEGNGRFGAVIIDAAVVMENVHVTAPDSVAGEFFAAGLVTGEAAILTLSSSTVASGAGALAILADQGSVVSVFDSTLSAGPGGLTVNPFGSSRMSIRDSTVSVSADEDPDFGQGFALYVDGQGDLRVVRSTFEGSLYVTEKSLLQIVGSTQTGTSFADGNFVHRGSTLFVGPNGPNGSKLLGFVDFSEFSNGVFRSGDPGRPVELGDLSCGDGSSNALCQGAAVSYGGSSCALCPPPPAP